MKLAQESNHGMAMRHHLHSIQIKGYRPFEDFVGRFGALEVLVGANGSGKSSLFEFLRFLRDSQNHEIPPEIIPGAIGQQVFHMPGPQKLWWSAEIHNETALSYLYQGELTGSVGRTRVSKERVLSSMPISSTDTRPHKFMEVTEGQGHVEEVEGERKRQDIRLSRGNQLALSTMTNPALPTLYGLREYVRSWRFYSAFNLATSKVRRSIPIEQEPTLHEDAGNLSSVLHYLMTEHLPAFQELQQHLRSAIPGFKALSVKARGGPGEVIAFWEEEGADSELSLADLSDGILRLLCWMVLCLHPNPPSLICIDEPDQGVHPRTLPILAGLFEKASERTQFILATHASYFLLQFDLSRIAVFRKKNGSAEFAKPQDSKALRENLTDFGAEEIEAMDALTGWCHPSAQLKLPAQS